MHIICTVHVVQAIMHPQKQSYLSFLYNSVLLPMSLAPPIHACAHTPVSQQLACALIRNRARVETSFPGHFLRGRKKGPGIICSRMREIPRKSWELGYAWIFSVYLLVVFRYIPAYVQRMMAAAAYSL